MYGPDDYAFFQTEEPDDIEMELQFPNISNSPTVMFSRKATVISPIFEGLEAQFTDSPGGGRDLADSRNQMSRALSRNLSRASFRLPSKRKNISKASPVRPLPFDPEEDYDFDFESDDEEETNKSAFSSANAMYRSAYKKMCDRLKIVPCSAALPQFGSVGFSLKNLQLTRKELKAIFITLINIVDVTDLDISGNRLSTKEIGYIVDILRTNKLISVLVLSSCSLSGKPLKKLADYLSTSNTLQYLDLSHNRLRDQDSSSVAQIIHENESIFDLRLSHNELGNSGIMIGHALKENETLKSIDLSWNHIRGNGAIGIAQGLQKNSSLLRVNLAWNGFGYEGCSALEKTLKQNTSITFLDLTNNRIHPPALFELIKGISHNKTLGVLRIAQNPITAPMTSILLQRILDSKHCGLKELDIEGVVVDKDFQPTLEKIQECRMFMARYDTALPIHKGHVTKVDPKNIFNIDPIRILYFMKEHMRTIDLFMKFDKDSDNSLTRDEMKFAFELEGYPISGDALDAVMSYLDTNKDGSVDLLRRNTPAESKSTENVRHQKYSEFMAGERRLKRKIISERDEKQNTPENVKRDNIDDVKKYSQAYQQTSPRLPRIKR